METSNVGGWFEFKMLVEVNNEIAVVQKVENNCFGTYFMLFLCFVNYKAIINCLKLSLYVCVCFDELHQLLCY